MWRRLLASCAGESAARSCCIPEACRKGVAPSLPPQEPFPRLRHNPSAVVVRTSESSLAQELEQLRDQGLYRPLRVLESPQGTEVLIEGRRLINLSSNNYLGLNTHPRLVAAMSRATEDM